MDDGFVDFLEFMERNGHFDDAVFVTYSDHGNHMHNEFGELTEEGNVEEMNPFFFMTLGRK
jgi:arylsulfatase A-like enzyme